MSRTYTSAGQLSQPVSKPYAGLAIYPDSSRKIIIAGGYPSVDYSQTYDLDTGVWLPGPLLPTDKKYAGESVPFGDTFLILGGKDASSSMTSSIHEFDSATETWILRNEYMDKVNAYFTAFWVPDEFCL